MRPIAVRIALLAAALIASPGVAVAQFPPPPPAPGSPAAAPAAPIEQRWPQPPQAPQAKPPQPRNQAPARSTVQNPPATTPAPRAKVAPKFVARPKAEPRAAPGLAVTCGGVFAKDTNQLKLAVKYDSRNVAYTDVEGPDHTRIKATVLFPLDPKRRLEVLWNDDAARSDVQVISINGQSNWTAPKGLKLGLSLGALQKLNGRPFKLSGFGPEGNASVLDWQGGALAALPGGCKVGVRLAAERGVQVAIASGRELLSNDAALKTVKANIAEILVGY